VGVICVHWISRRGTYRAFLLRKEGIAMRRPLVSIGVFLLAMALGAPAFADNFYEGKRIRFVVGYSPGGGFDVYTRVIARHIGKYIPGNPGTYVQNMPGAGSVVAANYLYNRATSDGLTVGVWNSGQILPQVLGDARMKFDGANFGWVGAPTKGTPTCAIMGFTGLKTLSDVLRSDRPINMGATSPGGLLHDMPATLNIILGTKFRVITGYPGSAQITVAMQARELDGYCLSWENMKPTARAMLDAQGEDRLIPFAIHRRLEDPEVKELPLFREVIRGQDNLATYDALVASMEFLYALSVPPRTPKDRLETLRAAFQRTLKDPEFVAEAKRADLDIIYVPGEEIETLVQGMVSISSAVKENLKFLVSGEKAGK
jgi:tripartite-type tricarboxylate transporter receptor subunit TctC